MNQKQARLAEKRRRTEVHAESVAVMIRGGGGRGRKASPCRQRRLWIGPHHSGVRCLRGLQGSLRGPAWGAGREQGSRGSQRLWGKQRDPVSPPLVAVPTESLSLAHPPASLDVSPGKSPRVACGHFPCRSAAGPPACKGAEGTVLSRVTHVDTRRFLTPRLSPASAGPGGLIKGAHGPRGPGRLEGAGDRPDVLRCTPRPRVTEIPFVT